MCVCVYVCMCVCVYVCMCVCERERAPFWCDEGAVSQEEVLQQAGVGVTLQNRSSTRFKKELRRIWVSHQIIRLQQSVLLPHT